MVSNESINKLCETLWKDPSTKNWESFARALQKNKQIKYYRTVYANGKIKKVQDLKKSWAELFDAKYKLITKVPLYKNIPGGIEGATIYLMGLNVANLVKK